MKKLTALIGSCFFFFIIMTLYLILDQFSASLDKDSFIRQAQKAAESVSQIRQDVEKLELKLEVSNHAIDTINEKVDDLAQPGEAAKRPKPLNLAEPIKFIPENQFSANEGGESMCAFTRPRSGHNQDINMLDFFEKIPFDDIDGGVWKQGWDIRYSEDAFDKKKLLVFVMPHSHNDPGWIKTLQQYFVDQTQHILTNVVNALAKDERRKFIWAEISYFSMWWDKANPGQKQMVQEQIRNGQLEIVTGGWVMNDEANPHYFNMLDQMVEGHQWLKNHIGVQPKYGWAIDPFGYTPTMAYLLKRMEFNGMLIQRVHYNVKKHLAKEKNLQFMWRQNWDHGNVTDIFTHSMPFYSYDVPHTCGPDPKICCQFDFRRLPGGGVACPWHVPPVAIDSGNVKQRAEMLLDQYRKKAQLYRSNVVLAPLGDDFRYEKTFETQVQYDNYEKIMNYINSHPELKAEIKFGTLKDYFTAVAEREGVSPGQHPPGFPSLGGDFFTYADRNDHYWSGYYTSRSFIKHLDRELAAHLRAAEIIFTLAHAHSKHHVEFNINECYRRLLVARKELALFQHHDGITGTAKDHVVVDYGQRMLRSIHDSVRVMELSANYLLTKFKGDYKEEVNDVPVMHFGESRENFDQVPVKRVVIISDQPSFVVLYNSLAQERMQVVSVHVSEPYLEIADANGDIIPHQVSLIWKSEREITRNKYELSFVATIPPLGLVRYSLKRTDLDLTGSLARTEVYHMAQPESSAKFKIIHGTDSQITIENRYLKAVFDGDDGLLTDMSIDGGHLDTVQIKFMQYGTVASSDRSGAYLFLPSGQASEIKNNNAPITVTRGKIFSEISAKLQYVCHKVRVYHVDVPEARSLDIRNTLDIRGTRNFELVMRIETNIQNKDKEFFTDLNGFQTSPLFIQRFLCHGLHCFEEFGILIYPHSKWEEALSALVQIQRRKSLGKLPLQANFYPVPTMIFLQDQKKRLTLQTQQSNGGASLEQGDLEVVMDRRLNQDDNRGLGQGVLDNKVTPSNFRLLLENFETENIQSTKPEPIAYPSALSTTLSHQLIHPIFTFSASIQKPSSYFGYFQGLKKTLPCDTHVVNLKMLQENIMPQPSDTAALFLHRIGYDCRFRWRCSEKKVTFQNIFEPLQIEEIKRTSLSLLTDYQISITGGTQVSVKPMEIETFKLKLK